LFIKINQLALCTEKIAIFSEINTKQTSTLWMNVKFLNFTPVGASRNQ